MPQTRKLVLDTMRAAMSDVTTGFNAQFAAVQGTYGIGEPVEIDWNTGSKSVFFGRVADARRTSLSDRVTVQMYTGSSQWTGDTKGMLWSGLIEGNILITVRFSHQDREEDAIEGIETIERWVEAVEDAVIRTFPRDLTLPAGVGFGRPPDCPALPESDTLEDGWQQVIPFRLIFHVDANE